MAEQETQTQGGFTPPNNAQLPKNNEVGPVDAPKQGGVQTQDKVSGKAQKTKDKSLRTIKVVALQPGWFSCKRIAEGTKFTVSEQEFSKIWMKKI